MKVHLRGWLRLRSASNALSREGSPAGLASTLLRQAQGKLLGDQPERRRPLPERMQKGRCLSEVEGRCLSEVEGRCLSEVEGSNSPTWMKFADPRAITFDYAPPCE